IMMAAALPHQQLQANLLAGVFKNVLPDIEVPPAGQIATSLTPDEARAFLERVSRSFARKSFKSHRIFQHGHSQTLAAYAWPRGFRFHSEADEKRYFDVAPGVKVLAHCRWQANRHEHPTIVAWHGIEGSSASVYMLATAEKSFRAGFNVIRVNFRNCGGTEHLTPTLYHGGLSEDLHAVVLELLEKDRLSRMLLMGFSLGGNLV